jgi:hypothetical protein
MDEVELGHGAQSHPLSQGMAQKAREAPIEQTLLLGARLVDREAGEEHLGVGQIPRHPHLLEGDVGQTGVPHLISQDLIELPL